jgi:hypothetical protein
MTNSLIETFIPRVSRRTAAVISVLFVLPGLPATAEAASDPALSVGGQAYFVRPYNPDVPTGVCDGTGNGYGHGNGNGLACAWNGLHDMQNNGFYKLRGGDTVFVIGTHLREIEDDTSFVGGVTWTVEGGVGTVTFRGDYDQAQPGVITALYRESRGDGLGSDDHPWVDCALGCPDAAGNLVAMAGVYYASVPSSRRIFNSRGVYEFWHGPNQYRELTPVSSLDGLATSGTIHVGANGQDVWVHPVDPANLTDNNIRWSGGPGYRFIFSSDGTRDVTFRKLTFFAPYFAWEQDNAQVENVIFQSNKFIREDTLHPKGLFKSVRFRNNEWDGRDKYANFLYPDYRATQLSDLYIDNNYIHNLFCDHEANCDGHAIGFLGSSADADLIHIRGNRFEQVGDAVTLYHTQQDGFDRVYIAWNWIQADYSRELNSASRGSGINLSSSGGTAIGINDRVKLMYNIVMPPENCPETTTTNCAGIRSNWRDAPELYGNLVVGNNVSYRFLPPVGAPRAVIKNNISLDPKFYHMYLRVTEGDMGQDWVEDHNLYHPVDVNNGNAFYYGRNATFAGYNNTHALNSRLVNANTLTIDPGFSEDLLLPAASPVATAGADLSAQVSLAAAPLSMSSPSTSVTAAGDPLDKSQRMGIRLSTGWKGFKDLADQSRMGAWAIGPFVFDLP